MKALLVLALLAATARADAPLSAMTAWKATRGSLGRGTLPGSFVLSSDGAPGRYSEGTMITTAPVALPFTLTATWRRLGPEAGRSMAVLVAGGIVLIKSGAIAFYAYDDAAFGQGDWRPIPGHRALLEHRIEVAQDKQHVRVRLDGAEVARYDLPVVSDTTTLGFGMKSAPGLRTQIYVRDIAVARQSQ